MNHWDHRVLQHAQILDLLLPNSRAVISDEDEFRLASSDALFRGPVTEAGFSALEDKCQLRVDRL